MRAGYGTCKGLLPRLSNRVLIVCRSIAIETHARRGFIQKLFHQGNLHYEDLFRVQLPRYNRKADTLKETLSFYNTRDIRYDFEVHTGRREEMGKARHSAKRKRWCERCETPEALMDSSDKSCPKPRQTLRQRNRTRRPQHGCTASAGR